ncbi:RNA polymerase sigma factor (sigma-70 family) [Catenulispora sp. GP43]|uniref:RNA polymerase sigma factor n=1 Tax=Catenulispora sp. GP43 TaxID=3156263 RepID=UPI003513CBE0
MPEPLPALEDFIREDRRHLIVYLLSLGLSLDEAQDAAADTYERLWIHRAQVKRFKSWCRTTAYRLAVDTYRAHQRVSATTRELRQLPGLGSIAGAEDVVMLKEEHRLVLARLRELPWKQRQVFTLHMEGMANKDIAELVMTKESTVASNIRHARTALRAKLEQDKVYTARSPEGGDIDGR